MRLKVVGMTVKTPSVRERKMLFKKIPPASRVFLKPLSERRAIFFQTVAHLLHMVLPAAVNTISQIALH